MNAYYEDGAVHNDHHKELTIGGNVTAEALKQIIAEFFDDDSDSEGCQPVDDAKKSASPAAGRVAEVLFPDKNGEKDDEQKMAYLTYTPEPGQTRDQAVKDIEKAEKIIKDAPDVQTIQSSIGGSNPMMGGGGNGGLVYIIYDPDTENFADKKTTLVKEIVANSIEFLTPKIDHEQRQAMQNEQNKVQKTQENTTIEPPFIDEGEDDLPF